MDVDMSPLEDQLRTQAVEWVNQMGDDFVERARARCSRRSGALADGCQHDEAVDGGDHVSMRVFNDVEYAQYQDEGTGIFIGDDPITPISAKALRFDWPAAGGVVFFKSVAGSPGTHFWSDTEAEFSDIVSGVQ